MCIISKDENITLTVLNRLKLIAKREDDLDIQKALETVEKYILDKANVKIPEWKCKCASCGNIVDKDAAFKRIDKEEYICFSCY